MPSVATHSPFAQKGRTTIVKVNAIPSISPIIRRASRAHTYAINLRFRTALAQLPPGESSPLASHRMQPAPMPAAPPGDGGASSVPPGQTPVVTLYGTSWCGACRAARQYLTEKKIPFADNPHVTSANTRMRTVRLIGGFPVRCR